MSTISETAQTTQDEYNYITKGINVQLEDGLDMKKGYTFVDYGTYELSEGTRKRTVEFKGLVKVGNTKPSAIKMIYKRTVPSSGYEQYVCIPSTDAPAEIWKQTNEVIKNFDKLGDPAELYRAFIYGLMKFVAQQTAM
jgi:hypothetical protein